MLCALGAVVFASAAASSARTSAALAIGFAVGALLTGGSALPDPVWTGSLAALGAAALLSFEPFGAFDTFDSFGERRTVRTIRTARTLGTIGFASGGAVAGSLAALLEAQGLPVLAAVLTAGALVIVTMRAASTRPGFAPDVVKDEALLGVVVLGLTVALLPGVLDGWQAATNLSGGQERAVEPVSIPIWTVALLLASSSLGAVYTLWSRR
jgi:hypothetical protein